MFIILCLLNFWILCGLITKDLNEEWALDNFNIVSSDDNVVSILLFLFGPFGTVLVYLGTKLT